MKHSNYKLSAATALTLAAALLPARAQWSQTTSTGPSIYTDPANWYGGVVTNLFTNAIQSGLTITFTNDYILSGGVIMGFPGSSNLTMQSDSATPRTLYISLGNILRTNANGGTITIGTTNNPLVLDLYNFTRTLGASIPATTAFGNASTMNVYAQIVDASAGPTNGIVCGGGNMFCYLWNTNNTFLGPVSFPSLRGGGFMSIKPIGGGASSLGAPVDSTNGTVTVTDGSSSGTLKYYGTGDTTDRPFNWVVTAYHTNQSWTGDYQFQNAGSGLLKFTGPWSFPTNRTTSAELVINAFSAPIEFDGYMNGVGNANGTFTYLLFAGGPAGVATNRITLTGATNDFRDFMISNVVVAYKSVAAPGTPCSLGAGTNIIVGGGTVTGGAWLGNNGQGSSLQYFGPNATFSRNITLNGVLGSFAWALDNAGTNTALTWSNNFAWNLPSAMTGFEPRYLFINPGYTATNSVLSYIPDANAVVSGQPIGTVVAAANPVGYTINNGGVLQLLNPTNTFAGGVLAAYGRTIQAMTLADIGQPSSIGTAQNPYTVGSPATQLGGINLGSVDSQRGGAFSYIGTTAASSNHKITILGLGALSGGTIRNDSPNNSSLHLTDTSGWTLYNTMTFCLATLGGTAHATNTLDSYMQDVNGAPGTGSLLVNGSAWRLTANQTYSGTTMVANATLLLDGSIAAGLGCTVGSGGFLAGTGTVSEAVTVLANGTIGAGDGGIGTLTIGGNLTNSGTVFMKLNKQAGTQDLLDMGGNTVVYGGTLSVINLAGNLAVGDSFKLFNAGTYQGAFTSISPATPPGSGLAWDLSTLASDGTLRIKAGAVSQPHITSTQLTADGLVMSGTNGQAGANFYILSSTNVALQLQYWTRISTNAFDGSGNFIVTNAVNPNFKADFFLLELQ
ncbi:MAG TPA: hypothetical protein VMU04_01120 [Candidatus Acidoferrum sp.]|nr:hypothetical protein [Candidatus Acidoferrum sp.]